MWCCGDGACCVVMVHVVWWCVCGVWKVGCGGVAVCVCVDGVCNDGVFCVVVLCCPEVLMCGVVWKGVWCGVRHVVVWCCVVVVSNGACCVVWVVWKGCGVVCVVVV